MSIRSFIFCDTCNPQGIRVMEFRRRARDNSRNGRRISDGRAWFDGDLSHAKRQGWQIDPDGQHTCPVCSKNIAALPPHG